MDIASALLAYIDSAESDPDGIGELLRGCTDGERRASLELLAAAVLDDGALSESERALLDRHGSGPAAAEVQRAMAAVEAAMPFPSDAERRRFLAARADLLRSASDRERLLGACVAVLETAGAKNLEARCLIFTSALGLSDAALARVRLR